MTMPVKINKLHWKALVLLSPVVMLGANARTTSKPDPMRYRFIEGQTNIYSVQIEVRGENGRESLNGNIFVSGKSISPNVFRVSFRGNLNPKREPVGPTYHSPGISPRWPANVVLNDSCDVWVNDRGCILRAGADHALPVPLGQLMHAFLEPLPEDADGRWELSDQTMVLDDPYNTGPAEVFISSQPYGSYYSAFAPGGRLFTALLPVRRHVTYQVKDRKGDCVTICKQLGLDSKLQTGSEPRMSASGKGMLIFDCKKGLLQQLDYEGKAVVNTESITRALSTSMHIRLLQGDELEELLHPPPSNQ